MPTMKLTKRAIDALPRATRSRGETYFDTELSGFGLTCYPTGRKSFIINFGPAKKRRRMTVGRYGVLTLDQARDRARKLLVQVLDGQDPLQDRQDARTIPTVDEWIAIYMAEVKLRKRSWQDDRRFLRWCSKLWGSRSIDSLTTEDLRQAFVNYGEEHGLVPGNRWLTSIRACLSAAWRSDHIQVNPAARVQRNPEPPPRTRVLSDEEMIRVWEAIQQLEDPHARVAMELLVVTGARRSEVLRARWEDFDLDARVWRIPAPKSGRPQMLPLSEEMAEKLRATPRFGTRVVAAIVPDKARWHLNPAWYAVREQAGIPDVRLHDLRRTYGLCVAKTAGLHIASKLLRHGDVRITERVYTPLDFEDLRRAQELVEETRANVIPLRRAR